jgi:hypothetical protein
MIKCQICGRTSRTGSKLCSDCSSARKRAFAATVTQPLLLAAGIGRAGGRLLRPSQSVAATARRSAERTLNAKSPATAAVVAASRGMEAIFLVAALVVVLLLGAYIAHQMQKGRQADAPQLVEQPVSASPGAMSSAVSVVPAGMSPKNVAETRMPDMTGAMTAADPAPIPVSRTESAKRTNPRQRGAPAETMGPPVEPPPAPPVVAVAPLPEPVAEVREVPKPDPLQQMNERLAGCASGGVIDHILCDQRVRREYCDGRWGQVPQCSSSVANDRGN